MTTNDANNQEPWRKNLAEIRDALLTVTFLNDDESMPWDEGWAGPKFSDVQAWAESLGDQAHGLFVPLTRLEASLTRWRGLAERAAKITEARQRGVLGSYDEAKLMDEWLSDYAEAEKKTDGR